MDDNLVAERLNQLGRLAELHVAGGTADTGKDEITHEEADRIIGQLIGQGATAAQCIRVLSGDLVFKGYRATLLRAAEWQAAAKP